MSRYYPVFLELTGQPCLVVGGGPVAETKVEALLDAGARVTVVSPRLTPRLDARSREGGFRHFARAYQPGDLHGYRLVFTTTGERAVTEAVAREAREAGIWMNAADDPDHCGFILPSVLRRGRLAIAVSTGGASPGLARAIREALEADFPEEYAALVDLVAEVRRELRDRNASPPPAAWRGALDADPRQLLAAGDRPGAKTWLLDRLGATP